MKLSVIIPTFNAGKYIEKCLESIISPISESNIEIELIIINDGSRDNTSEILQRFKNDKIQVFNNQNNGVSYSRNFGIKKATGDYIMFVDSDDVLMENWLKVISKSISEGNEEIIYYSSKIKENIDRERLLYYIMGYKAYCLAAPYSKIYKRSFIIDNHIEFNEDIIIGEDMLFNLKCYQKLKYYKVVTESFYLYRQACGTATKSFNSKCIVSDKKFHILLESILKNTEIKEEVVNDIIQYELNNGVIGILDKISYIDSYEKAKKEYSFVLENPYKDIINTATCKLDKNIRFYFKLCRKEKFKLIYNIMKIKIKIKQIKYKKETFIKI